MQKFNEEQSGSAASNLISHLVSSSVQLIFSLVLCFFWYDSADSRDCVGVGHGPTFLFGGLTFGYSIITVCLFGLVIGHLGFKPKCPKMLAVTTIGTSTASAILACVGIVVFEVLINDVRAPCAFSTIYYLSLVFLVIFVALNILLFVVAILHRKQIVIAERRMNEPKKSVCESWRVQPSKYDRPTLELASPEYTTWRKENAQVQRAAANDSSPSPNYVTNIEIEHVEHTINEPPNSDYVSWRKRPASFRIDLPTISEASLDDFEQKPVRLTLSPTSLYPMHQISPDTSFDHLDDWSERTL